MLWLHHHRLDSYVHSHGMSSDFNFESGKGLLHAWWRYLHKTFEIQRAQIHAPIKKKQAATKVVEDMAISRITEGLSQIPCRC